MAHFGANFAVVRLFASLVKSNKGGGNVGVGGRGVLVLVHVMKSAKRQANFYKIDIKLGQ